MKKHLLISLLASAALALSACGSDVANTSEKPEKKTTSEQKQEAKHEEKKVSNVEENDQLKTTNTYTNKDLGITGTTGPLNYSIDAIQLKEIEVKTEDAANMFEVSKGDTVHAITLEMTGENTSDEDMNFYLGQATVITNTKEQLEPDILLSENIEGEYLGKVKHEGYNVYILKNSTVQDLKTIEVRVSAPTNSNFDSIGDDIKQIIEVNQ